jgi:hypothetical protein
LIWNGRGPPQRVGDVVNASLPERHEDARHERELESHAAFAAISKVGRDILGPPVGAKEQDSAREFTVNPGAKRFEEGVRPGRFSQLVPLRSKM